MKDEKPDVNRHVSLCNFIASFTHFCDEFFHKKNQMRQENIFLLFLQHAIQCVCVARVCVEGSCNSDKHFARDISIAETTHERHHINIKIFLCFYNFLLHDSMKNFRVNKSRLRICFFRHHIFINKKF